MKATLKVLSLLALSSGLASAASTTLAAYYDTSFRTSTGTLLGSGFTARIGLTSATSFDPLTADFAEINATWTAVSNDLVTFQTSTGGFAGYFSGVFNYSTNAGSPIVLWVSDGADNNFVARLNNVVFENPANAPFDFNTYDIASFTVPDITILLGSYSTSLNDGFDGSGGNLILNNVPEPTSALLGAIGVLGMLRRRRI